MGLLGQMGDMYRLQKEAKKIQKELAKMHIFSESHGVKVTINAQQEVISVEITDPTVLQDSTKLTQGLVETFNKALKKSQSIAADKMKSVMGGLQGLMGGGPQ